MLSLIDVDGMVGEELVTEAAQNGGRLGLVPFVWDLAYRRGARTFHYGLRIVLPQADQGSKCWRRIERILSYVL
jgi:hypothetical protein